MKEDESYSEGPASDPSYSLSDAGLEEDEAAEDAYYYGLADPPQNAKPSSKSGSSTKHHAVASQTPKRENPPTRIMWTDKMRSDLLECRQWARQHRRNDNESIWPAIKARWDKIGYARLNRTERHLRDQVRHYEERGNADDSDEFEPPKHPLTPKSKSTKKATTPSQSPSSNNAIQSRAPPARVDRIEWTRKMKKDLRKCYLWAEKEYVRQYARDVKHLEKHWEDFKNARGMKGWSSTLVMLVKKRWESIGYASLNRSEESLRKQLNRQGIYTRNARILQEMAHLQVLQQKERREKRKRKQKKGKDKQRSKRDEKKKSKEIASGDSSSEGKRGEMDGNETESSESSSSLSGDTSSEMKGIEEEGEFARIAYQEVNNGPKVLMPVVRKSKRANKKRAATIAISDSDSSSESGREHSSGVDSSAHPLMRKRPSNYYDDSDHLGGNFGNSFIDPPSEQPLVKKLKMANETNNNNSSILLGSSEGPTCLGPELSEYSEDMNEDETGTSMRIRSPSPPRLSSLSGSQEEANESSALCENSNLPSEKADEESLDTIILKKINGNIASPKISDIVAERVETALSDVTMETKPTPSQPKPNSFLVNFLLKK